MVNKGKLFTYSIGNVSTVQGALGLCLVLAAQLSWAAGITSPARESERKALAAPSHSTEVKVEREERSTPPQADATVKFPIKAVRITGNTIFQADELEALVKEYAIPEQTLAGLEKAVAKVTQYYREHGYLVARAYLPAQEIKGGVVEIAVLEGRFGEVTFNNRSRTFGEVLKPYVTGDQLGEVINAQRLERALLLVGDAALMDEVQGVLRPGKVVGSSDLVVNVGEAAATPGPQTTMPILRASVDADNFGARVTGRDRIGATVQLYSVVTGRQLDAKVLTSGQGENYARLGYGLPVGGSGLRLSAAYTSSDYQIGEEFSVLDADGRESVWTLGATYPLLRSRVSNIYADAGYDHKRLDDHIGASASSTEKSNDILSFGLSGNRLEASGSATTIMLRIEYGKLAIETASEKAFDDLTARTDGTYRKHSYSLARYQRLSSRMLLIGSLSGQYASRNLDSTEKMSLGGPFGVRAYPVDTVMGDDGYLATVELRYAVAQTKLPGNLNLIGFIDSGNVSINHLPYVSGDNNRRLSGAGVGMTLAKPLDYQASLSYASKLGDNLLASEADTTSQFWLQLSKLF